MQNHLRFVLIAGATVIAAACASDMATSPAASSAARAALVTAPVSFDQIRTSFVGGSSESEGFVPGEVNSGGDNDSDHQEGEDGPEFGALMGGGIRDAFIGGLGFGLGLGRGPFGDFDDDDASCTFSMTSNRVECATLMRGGLTINRSFSFLDASGAVQQLFGPTTNTVNVKASVTGTVTHHENATSTVNSSSDFTIGGLASGSTQRTVDGKAAGNESTTGTNRAGVAFTAVRAAGDTTTGLKIPIASGEPTFPTAGTVIREMRATVTLGTSAPSTSDRREVITFDGSSTAKIVITHDGVTKNCTKPLPHGRLTCQ
jgi:hypothetical protein